MLQVSAQEFEWCLGQTHLLILRSLLEGQKASGNPLGIEMLVVAIFRILFYHNATSTGKHILESSI